MGSTLSLYVRFGEDKPNPRLAQLKATEYGIDQKTIRDLYRIMKMLKLTWAEVDRFHTAFVAFDCDKNGSIDRLEFTEAIGIQHSDFARECFHIITPKSRMNFIEFVAAITKICSANFEHLCRFAFRIVDVNSSGTLDMEELAKVVDILYGAQVAISDARFKGKARVADKVRSATANECMRIADADGNGRLTVNEFVEHARKFPHVVHPAFNLQKQLRKRIIGTYFWERRSAKLRERYDKVASGQFDSDWAEMGVGDWWGAYEQNWRQRALNDRDSLDWGIVGKKPDPGGSGGSKKKGAPAARRGSSVAPDEQGEGSEQQQPVDDHLSLLGLKGGGNKSKDKKAKKKGTQQEERENAGGGGESTSKNKVGPTPARARGDVRRAARSAGGAND